VDRSEFVNFGNRRLPHTPYRWPLRRFHLLASGKECAMNKKGLSAAVRASLGNAAALVALARIELHFGQSPKMRSQAELNDLIEKWADTIEGMDAVEIMLLKIRLRAGA
jgi:hypothetical protein